MTSWAVSCLPCAFICRNPGTEDDLLQEKIADVGIFYWREAFVLGIEQMIRTIIPSISYVSKERKATQEK